MPHAPLTLEERITILSRVCDEEEYVFNFGYDPQVPTWYCNIANMRSGIQIVEVLEDGMIATIEAMEEYLGV